MKKWQFSLILVGTVLLLLGVKILSLGVDNKDDRSENFTPPKNFRILVISDLNSQYGSTEYEPEIAKAIALIPKWQPDLVLCGGDMIAGQKQSLTKAQINAMWTAFEQNVAQPIREYQIPFGFTIGNHDGSGAMVKGQAIFAQERKLASAYWNNPQHHPQLQFSDRANFPFYYSFKQGGIFFLVWDASSAYISPEQLTWVKKSLTSQGAQQAKLKIAIGHLPLYPVAENKNKPGEYLANAEQLRSLLETYQVHTYISGHQHAYYPGQKGQLELLYAGALGQGARRLINSNLPPRNTVTIVDVELDSGQTIYTTYDIKTLEIIKTEGLPRSITGDNGTVYLRNTL